MKFPLPAMRRGASFAVALALLIVPVPAQRPAPKPAAPAANTTSPPQTPAAEQSPSATFDTLLSADAYGIYAEVRAVGRNAASQEIVQLLAPLSLEKGSAPDDWLKLYEFAKSHADELMSARLMIAAMPARAGLPEMLLAVEMPSVEEARKFVPELRRVVTANVAPPSKPAPDATTTAVNATPDDASNTTRRRGRRRGGRATAGSSAGENTTDAARAKQTPPPQVQIKRAGSLIALSDTNFTFKELRGADRPLLVNEPGFQAARTRFSTDTLFVYFNTLHMTNSSKQRREAYEKEHERQMELARIEAEKQGEEVNSNLPYGANMHPPSDANANFSVTPGGNMNSSNANVAVSPEDETPPPPPEESPEPTPSPKSEKELEEERRLEQSRRFAQTVGSLVFGGGAGSSEGWPESIGVGASLDGDALVVRGLFVSQSAEQPMRPIPFLPVLLSGPAVPTEATRVLPADTDISVSVSLDLPQMYDYLASLMKIADLTVTSEEGQPAFGEQLAAFEKTNNFRIREELLATLGNEIAVGVPGNLFLGRGIARTNGDGSAPPPQSGPIVVVALNDREGLQKLLPRVLASVGFAGATEQGIVEKHGEVEVLTFSNGTLAFIDRFLVGAPDAAAMRRITNAYNSGETLGNSESFRASTRWQSKQSIGQLYVSNALLKGLLGEVTRYAADIDDPAMRAYLVSLDPEPGALTHLVTRESDGLMHELRLPKNLLSLFTASTLVGQKLAAMHLNEGMAQISLQMIHTSQETFKKAEGRYGTLEEIEPSKSLKDESSHYSMTRAEGYEIKISVSGDTFTATATPTGYPKQGRRSFYIDQTGSLRGADTGGKPATASAPVIQEP
ncbi:MAG TPA: hypothetical protein VEY11_05835 [Pyrinomonadaceae bacterium]|nr:hypothetical protein [Pyrinomonadaceae bacterium]